MNVLSAKYRCGRHEVIEITFLSPQPPAVKFPEELACPGPSCYDETTHPMKLVEATTVERDGKVCICSGPPMRPCGPRCRYPLTDEAAERRE